MQEITTAISYSRMDTCDFLPGFFPVLRAFLLLALPMLCPGKFLLILSEEPGVACGEDHEVFQAQISPDGRFNGLMGCNILFNQHGNEIAISTVFRDRHSDWLTASRQGTGPHDVKRLSHFCQGKLTIFPLKSGGRVLSTLLIVPFLERGVFGATGKEVLKKPCPGVAMLAE